MQSLGELLGAGHPDLRALRREIEREEIERRLKGRVRARAAASDEEATAEEIRAAAAEKARQLREARERFGT